MTALGSMLAADVSLHADGGGKRSAALKPILGFDDVMDLHRTLAARFRERASTLVRVGLINGLPGFLTREADGELQTTALEIDGGKITAIYVMRNPDKLRHLHLSFALQRWNERMELPDAVGNRGGGLHEPTDSPTSGRQ